MSKGVEEIAAERAKQREQWGDEHDDAHDDGQLIEAAMAYAQCSIPGSVASDDEWSDYWPWEEQSWKFGPPRRMLVKAGALIAAEIDRIDRLGEGTD